MIPEDQRPPVGENFEQLERALVLAGATLPYPSTPALAPRIYAQLAAEQARRHRWLPRWGSARRMTYALLAALVVALVLLLAFPGTREALAQLLGLRTVRIIPVTPTPTPTAATRAPGNVPPPPAATGTVTPLPIPSATSTARPLTQCCETTLSEARALARNQILLPPGEEPSKVYLQRVPGFGEAQQVILVFGDPSAPSFTLYEATNFLYGKMVSEGTVIRETTVRGQRALWLSGAPHVLVYLDANGNPELGTERPVNANTLAWEAADVTFRVETNQSEEDAVRFAESLK